METDMAAMRTFARFLDLGHEMGVPVFPIYDSGDHLHPSDAGYKAMANAIDLKLFTTAK